MFAAIRYYQADPPSIDEVVRRVQEGLCPSSGTCGGLSPTSS
jgi:hypothetical protein